MILYNYNFINSIDLNYTFLPLPASETMNSVFILDIEVYYLTQFIFFVVSLVLLETILVYSSSQFNQEDSLSFHVSHLISDEEHLLYIFFICITTLIVIKIIVPILCYLSNEYSYTSLYFYVNVIVNHLF